MTANWLRINILSFLIASSITAPVVAELPNLMPFRRVDADPKKSYTLTEKHGPWLIIASSFAGEGAEKQAKELVLEIRRDYKLPAYIHKQHFDFTESLDGVNRHRQKAQLKYASSVEFDEIAVLVGNFASVDDPTLEKALHTIKHATPASLDLKQNKQTTQRFTGYRNLWKALTPKEEPKQRGPMRNAFATCNPLLPPEYFRGSGIDPFVKKMNREAEFSLLNNKAKYTVRVATFGGKSTMFFREDQNLDSSKDGKTMLEEAANKAHQLAKALRKKGVEAYEFHDRNESYVTIGSFDNDGVQLPDGSFQYEPGINKILERYRGTPKASVGQAAMSYEPRMENGILMDMNPTLIRVPRDSIAANYSRNRE